jgi:hypothetical protein
MNHWKESFSTIRGAGSNRDIPNSVPVELNNDVHCSLVGGLFQRCAKDETKLLWLAVSTKFRGSSTVRGSPFNAIQRKTTHAYGRWCKTVWHSFPFHFLARSQMRQKSSTGEVIRQENGAQKISFEGLSFYWIRRPIHMFRLIFTDRLLWSEYHAEISRIMRQPC